jgi:hypothetical protein
MAEPIRDHGCTGAILRRGEIRSPQQAARRSCAGYRMKKSTEAEIATLESMVALDTNDGGPETLIKEMK